MHLPSFLHIHSRQSKRNKSPFCLMLWKNGFNMNILTSLPWKSIVCCCFALHIYSHSLPYLELNFWSCSHIPTEMFARNIGWGLFAGHPTGCSWGTPVAQPHLGTHTDQKNPHSSIRRSQKPHLYADDNKHIKPLQLIKTWQLSPKGCLQAKGCNDKSPSWFPIKQENFNHLFQTVAERGICCDIFTRACWSYIWSSRVLHCHQISPHCC